jgi:hypothetical protein
MITDAHGNNCSCDAEVSVLDENGEFIKPKGFSDVTKGYQTPSDVLNLLNLVKKQKPKKQKGEKNGRQN